MSQLPTVFHISDKDQHHSLIIYKFLTSNFGDNEGHFSTGKFILAQIVYTLPKILRYRAESVLVDITFFLALNNNNFITILHRMSSRKTPSYILTYVFV